MVYLLIGADAGAKEISFKKIKQEFNGDFLITKEVKREAIDYPESTRRFEL